MTTGLQKEGESRRPWYKKKRYIVSISLLLLFVVVGAIGGSTESTTTPAPGEDTSAPAAQDSATNQAEPAPTAEPTPEPVEVVVGSPSSTTQDTATLRGTVSDPDVKVRVKGASDVRMKGKRWAADVTIDGVGNHTFRIVATLPGAKTDRVTATVVRKQSAAEKAVEAAQDRANFIASTTTLDYDQLAKNPDNYRGTDVTMRGQIFQIGEDYGSTWMLLSVTDMGYDYWDDNVWVEYDGTIQGAEDDIITIYGTVKGEYSYDTQAGGSTYVPKVKAEYVDE